MADERILEVQAQEDFVEKLAAARPAQALAELLWNGLDAEATKVSVEADRGPIGLTSIRVRDNGHGMAPEEAEGLFTSLGGSWKRGAKQSKNGKRMLHGEEGNGRFRALALGRVVEWNVTAANASSQVVRYHITMIKDSARTFRLSEPTPVEDGAEIGVEVIISEPYKDWNLEAAGLLQELNEIYALYLTDYPAALVTVSGTKLDPSGLIDVRRTFPLPPIPNGDRPPYPAELEVVEWTTQTERMLYLCNAGGFPLHRTAPGIHAPGYDFSAYLRSEYVSLLHDQGTLDLAELDPRLNEAVENAKGELREHFKARAIEQAQSLVDEWKAEQVYPYAEEPETSVQIVERKVFDIVAVNVATSLPDFQVQDQRNRRFQLRMLRQAVERSPEELQLIIGEVLGLSQRKQEELARLLKRTTLSAIISAAKMVGDRLDFLSGLETMLFDPDLKKNFKERTQLHRILAGNTWVFGEEFALTVDDQSLTEVLRQHLKAAGREIVINEPVKRLDDTAGIVDLMLSRGVPSNLENELDHLVIELKAPTVKVGPKEITQIKSYAFPIREDERFRGVPARWTFWLVANDMDEFAAQDVQQPGRPQGVLWESPDLRSRIWVRTWAQIIHDCKTRLKIFQKELNHSADRDASLDYLKKTYARVLQGGEASQSDNSDHDVARGDASTVGQ
ncbi:MAG: DNA mismatch repair protein [Acidobacteria bacterium]|nr:MAG: DNA mismatch repair protein [Acidobacteriota bacterium]